MVSDSFYNGNYSYDHICTKMYTMKHEWMNEWRACYRKIQILRAVNGLPCGGTNPQEKGRSLERRVGLAFAGVTSSAQTWTHDWGWNVKSEWNCCSIWTDASLQNWGISLHATWHGSPLVGDSLVKKWHELMHRYKIEAFHSMQHDGENHVQRTFADPSVQYDIPALHMQGYGRQDEPSDAIDHSTRTEKVTQQSTWNGHGFR